MTVSITNRFTVHTNPFLLHLDELSGSKISFEHVIRVVSGNTQTI